MNLKLHRQRAVDALRIVGRAVRPSDDIMGNVLLKAEGRNLRLMGTNRMISIAHDTDAIVQKEGEITLPLLTLLQTLDRLEDEYVDLEVNDKTLSATISHQRGRSRLRGIAAIEYPPINMETKSKHPLLIGSGLRLKEAIQKTAFAIAKPSSGMMRLTGICFRVHKDQLTMGATNSYMASEVTVQLLSSRDDQELIIPGNELVQLSRILGDSQVDIYPEGNTVVFYHGRTSMRIPTLEGPFVNYEQFFLDRYQHEFVVQKSSFLQALQASEVFAKEDSHRVRLTIKPHNGVVLSSVSQQTGDSEIHTHSQNQGGELTVKLNCEYLREIVESLHTENVVFRTNSEKEFAFVEPQGGGQRCLIAPMT